MVDTKLIYNRLLEKASSLSKDKVTAQRATSLCLMADSTQRQTSLLFGTRVEAVK